MEGFMFTIFRRPKPQFRVGQIVFVPQEKESGPGYYMQIRGRQWVRQGGYGCAHWDWFYTGVTFGVKGTSLVQRSREESHREQELFYFELFDE